VHWNRLYEPAVIERDRQVRRELEKRGIEVHEHSSYLLLEPGSVLNKSDAPYKVFTPFWKACKNKLPQQAPLPVPSLEPGETQLESLTVDDLGLLPTINWYEGFAENWTPGEDAGLNRLDEFVADTVADYADDRNRPDLPGTSRLSPHLHFGEVTPRQVLWSAQTASETSAGADTGIEKFVNEIGWREFAHHLLVHFPHTTEKPLREDFEGFPWHQPAQDEADFVAWCKGTTQVPLVDAGMRELWHTGWMHNRVRMVVASFLTKNQLITWQAGARWFWDTLVDANLASNTLGWQWTAGCGADAAPFFRIFNPVRQGEKFDPDELYVRRWCEELEQIPQGSAHEPWKADGQHPGPIVDLGESRTRALDAFQQIKRSA
jgi:deoxyribodipyrimidine photo-lyase